MSEHERYHLRGWMIAAKSIKKMDQREVAFWLRHLQRIPVKDAEARGMIDALLASGVDGRIGAEDEVASRGDALWVIAQ